MSILILGSNGFIGKNLKFFFKERGVAYEEFTKKKNTKLSEKINKCDFIIHLADKIKSKKKKILIFQSNLHQILFQIS